jgi:hypothetical protein
MITGQQADDSNQVMVNNSSTGQVIFYNFFTIYHYNFHFQNKSIAEDAGIN